MNIITVIFLRLSKIAYTKFSAVPLLFVFWLLVQDSIDQVLDCDELLYLMPEGSVKSYAQISPAWLEVVRSREEMRREAYGFLSDG